MTLEVLQKDMIAAMKAKDKVRKDALSSLVSAVKKAGIDANCRENIPEDMVNKTITKELKTIKEQIDTCPEARTDLLEVYKATYDIVKEYAPVMLGKDEIMTILTTQYDEVVKTKNKGMIMKTVMADLKGKADGKLIGECVASLCS